MARKLFRRLTKSADTFLETRFMQRMGPWMRHPNLWHVNRHSAAGGVAIGLATGLIPGPLQMLTAAALSIGFRVNLPIALVTTLYTNPFTIVPLYLTAYTLGGLVTGESVRDVDVPHIDWDLTNPGAAFREGFDWLMSLGSTLAIGLAMQSALLAVLGYFGVRILWRWIVIREWRKRRARRTAAS